MVDCEISFRCWGCRPEGSGTETGFRPAHRSLGEGRGCPGTRDAQSCHRAPRIVRRRPLQLRRHLVENLWPWPPCLWLRIKGLLQEHLGRRRRRRSATKVTGTLTSQGVCSGPINDILTIRDDRTKWKSKPSGRGRWIATLGSRASFRLKRRARSHSADDQVQARFRRETLLQTMIRTMVCARSVERGFRMIRTPRRSRA